MKNKETVYGFIQFSNDIKNRLSKLNMNTQTERKKKELSIKEG
jgi:hypothetical protein